eukprot:Gb_00104 [translate_table: standard]
MGQSAHRQHPKLPLQLFQTRISLPGTKPAKRNGAHTDRLDLAHNRMSGVLPLSIGRLPTQLSHLYINNNSIGGSIPPHIGNLTNLTDVSLSYNLFSGSIPSEIKILRNLERLRIRTNRLQGSIPSEISHLQTLGLLSLTQNMLSGQIPESLGDLQQLRRLDISENQLSGEIPATLGKCWLLELLDLSYNRLEGEIPPGVAGLPNLQFSYNNLSGAIPKSMEKLKMLRRLNFSFNNFTGEIPKTGIFPSLTAESFLGNPRLCGARKFLSRCPTPTVVKRKDHSFIAKKVILPVSSIGAFMLICLLVGFFWRHYLCGNRLTLPLKLGYPRISYEELSTATNGFSEANLLGVGSFGSTFKGILDDGKIVAVKVFDLRNEEEAQRSFTRECKALGRARHRNLVKVITSCSNLEFKGLVLEFMSNGNLEKHLYCNNDNECTGADVCGLSLLERLNIAIDIANGIAYLHHNCSVQIVHCDLKPANVLLDDNMTARVTDFGVSRLIRGDDMNSFTSTLVVRGSIGYIAPEYGLGARISTKGDVYSYGILLLEMLTRKRPTSDTFVEGLNLPKWVSISLPDRMIEMVDNSLLRDDGMEESRRVNQCLVQLFRLGLICARESPEERPSMIQVLGVLERIRESIVGTAEPSGLTRSISTLLERTRVRGIDAETSESSDAY